MFTSRKSGSTHQLIRAPSAPATITLNVTSRTGQGAVHKRHRRREDMAPQARRNRSELFSDDRTLLGIDGITFIGDTLYENNVIFNKLYRLPMDASGKARSRTADI